MPLVAGRRHPVGARTRLGGTQVPGKAWLLLCLPVGFTTRAAFLYIGIRARRPRWLVWAGVYAAMFVGYGVLDTPAHPSETAKGLAVGLALATWIGGGVHALVVSNDAVRRIQPATTRRLRPPRPASSAVPRGGACWPASPPSPGNSASGGRTSLA